MNDMNTIFDVAVVGGGIAGTSFAYRMARHRSLVILEREAHVGYHSTGRSAAEFSRQFQTPSTGLLADGSFDFLANPPPGFADVPLLVPRGNLVIAQAERKSLLAAAFREVLETSPETRTASSLRRARGSLRQVPLISHQSVMRATSSREGLRASRSLLRCST